jgi:hypothetical protein
MYQTLWSQDDLSEAGHISSNKIRSMHFEFDMTTQWRVIKNLTVVGDATHEALTIVSEASADFK